LTTDIENRYGKQTWIWAWKLDIENVLGHGKYTWKIDIKNGTWTW
jgi:hypothetical protein